MSIGVYLFLNELRKLNYVGPFWYITFHRFDGLEVSYSGLRHNHHVYEKINYVQYHHP